MSDKPINWRTGVDGWWSQTGIHDRCHRRVWFSERGLARLAELSGMCSAWEAIDLPPVVALAAGFCPAEAAKSLDSAVGLMLLRRAQYGGEVTYGLDDGRIAVKHPAFKYVLSDDGSGPGNFTFAAYRAVAFDHIHSWGRKQNPNLSYEAQVESGEKHYKIPERSLRLNLRSTRFYTPQWVKEKRAQLEKEHAEQGHEGVSPWSCDDCDTYGFRTFEHVVDYGFAFNGLIRITDIGSSDAGSSIHT